MWGGRRHVSTIRLGTLAIWGLIVATTPYVTYSAFWETTEGFGVGRALLFDRIAIQALFSKPVLITLQCGALLLSVIAIATTWRSTLVVRLLLVHVIALDAISKSLGAFANHAQVAPLLALGAFACLGDRSFMSAPELFTSSSSCTALSGRQQLTRREDFQRGFGVAWLMGIIIILPYSYIGLERLASGGLALFYGDSLIQYLSAASRSYQTYPEWFNPTALRPLLNAGFLAVTLLEATSGLLLVSRSYRLVWLCGIGAFQLCTPFLMNIFFWENLVLAAIIFWPGWRRGAAIGRAKT